MSATRYHALLGLGFGDCGKGLHTDQLCARLGAHTVVRFNGGAQAGHNVLRPDGRHHTFSQFGAGSFLPGVATVLAAPVVVHPGALAVEAQALARVGVHDALERLTIDARCRLTTPFHQAAGRLREWQRGEQAHGSCGVGVGETVRQSIEASELTLRWDDLRHPARALALLQAQRERLWREFEPLRPPHAEAARERALLADERIAARWLAAVAPVVAALPPSSPEQVAQRLSRPGDVVFEGAQGVLLDEWRGFHPHTTWSRIATDAVDAVLRALGIGASVRHIGVLRSHLSRHGAGPLPTHDPALDAALPEPHNASGGWQGAFRRGHPDAVLWRYALDAAGPGLQGLAVTHLDVFGRGLPLRWCEAYALDDGGRVDALPLSPGFDLGHQERLTRQLSRARPRYAPKPVRDADEWLARVRALSGLPVLWGAHGPTREQVRAID